MKNVIEEALAMLETGDVIELVHLPEDFLAQSVRGAPVDATARASVGIVRTVHEHQATKLGEIELELIEEALRANRGNISATARQLGVSRITIYRKLKSRGEISS
jgi:sigma-54 dependent transcriptional regulator, acetoin dehydrogenase operon transcriptional activator AcoR